jgi:hypothetical protein
MEGIPVPHVKLIPASSNVQMISSLSPQGSSKRARDVEKC